MGIFSKIFGTYSSRELKKITPIVDSIEALGDSYKKLTDQQLRAKTDEFKSRLAAGETLDDILPEAFATVREAADRVLGMRHYRVQLICGVVLHQGRIAEMKTGEGKTLVATLPSYLNALTGRGVHVVTVNDYLASRDSEWMGKVHRFLGLSVGLIVHGMTSEERKKAYACDITYGTNSEIGFDYLRDNMAIYKDQVVQRGHVFAIVDEVDSILIDEARTPLIISGKGDTSTQLYAQVDAFVSRLRKAVFASTDEKRIIDDETDADYIVDEKARTATLTARGIAKAEAEFNLENLADLENSTLSHHINQALKAHGLMHRDENYVVQDGKVVIIDEFTGRAMPGRRYSEGLHQAIEAKEGVSVENESKTLATITYQNFFRLYDKLSGMTGTALTEADEFSAIYHLDIIEIPTNRPMIRRDHPDVMYKNTDGKYRAIIAQIEQCHAKGQPVLVGTITIDKSEKLSAMLRKKGIKHNVLNAKQHEREAEIVAQAGKFGAVTIATNMAGRGTDIMLGGNPEYLARNDLKKAGFPEDVISEATGHADTDDEEILKARAMFAEKLEEHKKVTSAEADKVRAVGGLFILGTERHEARRIDNQLRGRAGRQGDPGESRFYIAMTDDLMRLFGTDRVAGLVKNLDEDTPIDPKILSASIEQAQKRVESRNFQTRKTVLEYDDVMNQQRNIIYDQRRKVLDGEDIHSYVSSMITDVIDSTVHGEIAKLGKVSDVSEIAEIITPFRPMFIVPQEVPALFPNAAGMSADDISAVLQKKAFDVYEQKEKRLGNIPGTDTPLMRELERVIMLRVVDEYWMDHIDAMTDLRQGISLLAYGQQNPVDAYKKEGFEMFEAMVNGIKEEVVRRIFTVRVNINQKLERKSVSRDFTTAQKAGSGPKRQPVRAGKKIGRNDPCPCGKLRPNGLPMKYKDCCGKNL